MQKGWTNRVIITVGIFLLIGGMFARQSVLYSKKNISSPVHQTENISQLDSQSGNFWVENIQWFWNQETYDSGKPWGYNPWSTVSSPSKPDDSTCNPMECGDSIYNSNPCSLGSVIEGAGTQRSYAGVSRTCTYTNNGQTFKLSPKCQGKCKVGYVWNGDKCDESLETRCPSEDPIPLAKKDTCSFWDPKSLTESTGEKEKWNCKINVENGKSKGGSIIDTKTCLICDTANGYEKNADGVCVKTCNSANGWFPYCFDINFD